MTLSKNALHTVTITGDEEHPRIEFTCNGGTESACHNYPACDCETWDDDHHHPKVTHIACWMQPWFDNDCISPMSEQGILDDCEYKVGMSGPITTTFCHDYVEWEFSPAKPSEESL
ncbi:hypothetical protein ACH49M_21395 [Rhodococcus qingshengii]|uniref:hypothetical protein n=1 Tax=Rhodococcus qingshengii TaxID=334542 RepID=UPI0036FCF87D